MTPAQAHINWHVFVSAGIGPTLTVGTAPTQGPGIRGTQGIGVSTPCAAAVAAMTVGFAMLLHIPKGGMFNIGTLSMMLAAGVPPFRERLAGRTFSVLGARPKVHIIVAPDTT